LTLALVGEGAVTDLWPIGVADKAIRVETKRVCGQHSVRPSTHAPKRFGAIQFNLELTGQLTVKHLEDVQTAVIEMDERWRELSVLVAARDSRQLCAALLNQHGGNRCTAVTAVETNAFRQLE
jgi:hypothetical protein